MAMTMIVLGAMMIAFSYGSREMRKGRAGVELISKLQATTELLRSDLEQISIETKPHHFSASAANGYFEIVEGGRTDYNEVDLLVDPATGGDDSRLGDFDDFIAFTIKSSDTPFLGSNDGCVEESHYAEVAWFVSGNRLYRKVRIVRPDEGRSTLEQLGFRGKRYGHRDGNEPHTSQLSMSDLLADVSENDIVLRNVIAFDVRVFAPDAAKFIVRSGPGLNDPIVDVLHPSDIGARNGVPNGRIDPTLRGAFIDLGKGGGAPGNRPLLLSRPHGRYREAVYDTGTSRYNNDETNDQGSNGVDDPPHNSLAGKPNGIIDDAEEKASLPPYNVPLRGVQISVRAIEPYTKQVRQLTVVKSLSPRK